MDSLFRVLDHSADGAFTIDENQQIVHWNAAAQAILGYTAEDVLGRSCYEIVRGRNDDDRAWCRNDCFVAQSLESGDQVNAFNTCARDKSGSLHWINVSILCFPVGGDDGEQLVVHLFRDATDQKQQERFAQQVLSVTHSFQRERQPAPQAATTTALPAHNQLTPRELDVLALLARGLSTKQITQTLSISPSTTRNHIQNILQKLHVHSRAAAVSYAFEHGILAKG